MLHARAAKGIEEEVERGVQIPVGKGFAGRIAAERRPIVIADVDHADILNPILREKGIRSLLGVPLLAEDRVLGVLHVGSLTPRTFTTDERDLLQLAADRAAVAIEHAQLYERRRLADALQRRLLPDLREVAGAGAREPLPAGERRGHGRRLVRRVLDRRRADRGRRRRRGRPRRRRRGDDGAAPDRAARVRDRRPRAGRRRGAGQRAGLRARPADDDHARVRGDRAGARSRSRR